MLELYQVSYIQVCLDLFQISWTDQLSDVCVCDLSSAPLSVTLHCCMGFLSLHVTLTLTHPLLLVHVSGFSDVYVIKV